MGEMRNARKILVDNLKGGDHLERPRCRWEDNIRVTFILEKLEYEGVDWNHMAPDMDQWKALVNTKVKPQVP
jgi:hypothetical protein